MKRFKVLICLLLALVLVMGMASSAMAASFYFKFRPGDKPKANYTSYEKCDGTDSAYVDPSTSVETIYSLLDGNIYVSNAVTSTGSKKRFSYEGKYGRAEDSYRMIGAPNPYDYEEYHVSGTWKP